MLKRQLLSSSLEGSNSAVQMLARGPRRVSWHVETAVLLTRAGVAGSGACDSTFDGTSPPAPRPRGGLAGWPQPSSPPGTQPEKKKEKKNQ